MMENLFERITPIKLRSWRAALLPLILGTGFFTIFYFFTLYNNLPGSTERGLFEYHSTTFGDILIVPLTWYLIAEYYSHAEPLNIKRKSWVTPLAIIASLIITSAHTISSMYGNERDWTLPSYGVINFQGVYHSFFIAFMLSSYIVFIFDHWNLISRPYLDTANKKDLSRLYWFLINLFVFFLTLLSSDAYYNKDVKSFFIAPFQQFLIFIILILNSFATVKNKALPVNLFSFAVLQSVIYVSTIAAGYFLSKNPLMW